MVSDVIANYMFTSSRPDEAAALNIHCYADANFGTDGGKSTSGVQVQFEGPRTCFPVAAVSVAQQSVPHSTPEAEIVAFALALRKMGIPILEFWSILKTAKLTKEQINAILAEDQQRDKTSGKEADVTCNTAPDGEEAPAPGAATACAGIDKAARKRERKADAHAQSNDRVTRERGQVNPIRPAIIFHEDNSAMVSICKTGSNPSLRHLGRVHNVGLNFLHQEVHKPYVSLGYIAPKEMCADIHTKSFPSARADEWNAVRRNVNVIHRPCEDTLIGRPGHGFVNLMVNPANYQTKTAPVQHDDVETVGLTASVMEAEGGYFE